MKRVMTQIGQSAWSYNHPTLTLRVLPPLKGRVGVG